MSWVTVTMDPIDNKVKIDWIYIRKIVIGTVREDQFLYILFEICFKYNFDCHSVSFSILRSPFLRVSPLFYTIFPFHLYPPHQIASMDPCPISIFLKSWIVAVRLKTTVQVSFPH